MKSRLKGGFSVDAVRSEVKRLRALREESKDVGMFLLFLE